MTASAAPDGRPPKPEMPPFTGLPDYPALRELRAHDQWFVWTYTWNKDRAKWDKPPMNARTGGNGSCTNPKTWSPYVVAEQKAKQDGLAGVGFALDADGNISGIDLDKCRNPETGEFQAWAQVAIDFGETYAEVSPSGTGLRFFVLGTVDGRKIDAAQVEIYTEGRYLTVTGEHVDGTPTEIRPAPKLIAYLQERADQFQAAQRAAADMVREAERKRREKEAASAAEAGEQPQQTTSERAQASAKARGGRIHEAFASASASEPDPFWKNVNSRALANLDAWVPILLPAAKRSANGGWRVTSKDLGRDLEEDLSINPGGAKDFGTWDMGDPNDGKRTPIALVLEYGTATTAAEAALWLCDKLGIAPEVLGWRGGQRDDAAGSQQEGQHQGADSAGQTGQQEPPPPTFEARPFEWIEPSLIPQRRWVLARHLIRQYVSVTAAPGGFGKSSLIIADALALATGRNLIGHQPHGRHRVLIWNGEDPLEELQRRIIAACLYYEIAREDIEGWLFVNSGRDDPITVATVDRNGVKIAVPAVEAFKATLLKNEIDVFYIDPFVSCHEVPENDNGAIDRVAKTWGRIAGETDCAAELVHHTKKTGGNEVTMEDLRGAGALLAAARSGRVLNGMTKDEAERAGVKERRLHFRLDNGKANLAPPPSEGSTWFKMQSVPLMNGGNVTCGSGGFELEGDSVGVVTAWEMPNPFDGVEVADLLAAQKEVAGGQAAGARWRQNSQAKEWVGRPIARALKLDPENKAHKQRINQLLKVWIENEMFVVIEGQTDQRKPCSFVEVGTWACAT